MRQITVSFDEDISDNFGSFLECMNLKLYIAREVNVTLGWAGIENSVKNENSCLAFPDLIRPHSKMWLCEIKSIDFEKSHVVLCNLTAALG